jgi:hypothetical protein
MKKMIFFMSFFFLGLLASADLFSQIDECWQDSCSSPLYSTSFCHYNQCGGSVLCCYTAKYRVCQGHAIIESVESYSSNDPCCIAAAINSPMVSGWLLDEAAQQIAKDLGNGIHNIYKPSRCWTWNIISGGPQGYIDVLEPCSDGLSCCIFTYEVVNEIPTLISSTSVDEEICIVEGCFQICE